MRLRSVRFPLWGMLALVAIVGVSLGVERLWRRSEHFRKQAALCGYLEIRDQESAKTGYVVVYGPPPTLEEREQHAQQCLAASRRYATLEKVYQRLGRHPWETLPPDIPHSIEGGDLDSLSVSKIEDMTRRSRESYADLRSRSGDTAD